MCVYFESIWDFKGTGHSRYYKRNVTKDMRKIGGKDMLIIFATAVTYVIGCGI